MLSQYYLAQIIPLSKLAINQRAENLSKNGFGVKILIFVSVDNNLLNLSSYGSKFMGGVRDIFISELKTG